MQTFLPYEDFERCASVLDYRRLGKQRVETLQILQAIAFDTRWRNHAATKMWVGYEVALIAYGSIVCMEWLDRGYKDACHAKIGAFTEIFGDEVELPHWLGDEDLHASHRSNLMRKDPKYYKQFFDEPSTYPYIWPRGKFEENEK